MSVSCLTQVGHVSTPALLVVVWGCDSHSNCEETREQGLPFSLLIIVRAKIAEKTYEPSVSFCVSTYETYVSFMLCFNI